MNTSRFLIHWCGRIARRSAPGVEASAAGEAVPGTERDSRGSLSLERYAVRSRHGAAADIVMKSRAHHDWK